MKSRKVEVVISVLVFLLICAESIAAQSGPSDQPFFETGVVAKAIGGPYFTNAYPVVARTSTGRLLCIFSAAATQPKKLKIAAAYSDDGGRTWSTPNTVFDTSGMEDADPNLIIDGDRILAFSTTLPPPFRIDYTEIWMRQSRDNGETWSEPVLLRTPHRYICGKIHVGHRLADGTLVMGYSWDTWIEKGLIPATEGEMNLKAGVLRSKDSGKTWTPGGDLYARIEKTSPHSVSGLDEPATVVLADGRLFALLRNSSTKFYESFSKDGGLAWSAPKPSPLTAHNSPAALWRLDKSRDVLAVWDNSPTARHPLVVALSQDDCRTWSEPKVIVETDGPQVSYPSATQASGGALVVVWQQDLPEKNGRDVRVARFNRAWLLSKAR